MEGREHKAKSPYRWLLAIPIQLVINVLMVPLGVWIDMKFWEASARAMIEEQGYVEGHGIPIFTVLIPLIGAGVTIYVIVAAIICTVILLIKTRKNQQMDGQKSKSESPYRWLLAIPIQLGIDVLLVLLGMGVDALQGYVKGHGIPVITILTSLTVAVVTVFVTVAAIVRMVISLIRAGKVKYPTAS